ncbi:virulence factor TspB C-terminal domain-related protein [Variovorax sp. GB1P17]|uniref:virulence factor TspB C-terminal domain-related protein n=1 Tax=Variovorax sp. GB1P17 TaxID=3443740 RepID=UPI003F487F14
MITKAAYAFFHRNDARAWLVALALGCVWLNAGAVNKGNISRVQVQSNGRSTAIGPVTNSGGSTIPVSPEKGGWTQAGNYGVPPGATGPTVSTQINGEVVFHGPSSKYPFQGNTQSTTSGWVVPALGAAAAIGCTFATGGLATAACLALPIAMPYLYDWITRSGGRINPETGELQRSQTQTKWNLTSGSLRDLGFWESGAEACRSSSIVQAYLDKTAFDSVGPNTVESQSFSSPFCIRMVKRTTGSGSVSQVTAALQATNVTQIGWLPSSMDDIAPYMKNVQPDGRVWGEALEKGAEMPLSIPTVTGPSQIQGPEKSTTNPDGSRTVERNIYNFQTSGNTITNTTNVTNTTTYNSDNSVRSVSSTTKTPTAEEADKDSECEKRPNSAGCADLDTPTGEIPRETKTITYAEESVFGGGSCPSDKQWSSGTTGHSYKLVDWGTLCGFAAPARALVILLAIFAAFLIVMPGKEVRT